MKKYLLLILSVSLLLTLAACANTQGGSKTLTKEGIAPYPLTEDETSLLEAFGMASTSQILNFRAPKGTKSIVVNVYRLGQDGAWETVGNGAIYTDNVQETDEALAGTFTMQLLENYQIACSLNCAGRYSFESDALSPEADLMASTWTFLTEFQEITENTEIPVAIMVYDSGTSMRSHELEEYFEPSAFEGMDLVQAVTVTFSDSQ